MLVESTTGGSEMHIAASGANSKMPMIAANHSHLTPEKSKEHRSSDLAAPLDLVIKQAPGHDSSRENNGHSIKKSHGAYELKFLISDEQASKIKHWAEQRLGPDPHCDPEIGDGYRVNSLYLDTPHFDLFHQTSGFRKRKFRLRRYGRESVVYVEQKQKRKGLVRKKRVVIAEADLDARLKDAADSQWEGNWFRERIDQQRLRPVCQISYRRFARVHQVDEGPLRLTIDNEIAGVASDEWSVPSGNVSGVSLLEGRQILEMKFRGAMPGMFRQLIDSMQLMASSFSKYRTCVKECIAIDAPPGRDDRETDNA